MKALPLVVNLVGQRCLVVGGGRVGQRKASALLAAGAIVRVVSLDAPALAGVEWLTAPYHADHCAGCVLVCAAASPAVNERVVADARARGLWVNSASDPAAGSITFPAVSHVGPTTIAVHTGGAAPLLARRIATLLAEQCDPALATWVELVGEVRAHVLATLPDLATRRAVFVALAEPHWLERLRTDDVKVVRAAMHALVDEASKR